MSEQRMEKIGDLWWLQPDMPGGNSSFRDAKSVQLVSGGIWLRSYNGSTAAEFRIYTNASGWTAYAAIWLNGEEADYRHGFGKASGYGYDKQSAALSKACRNAGLVTKNLFGGNGMNTAIEVLHPVLEDIYSEKLFFVRYGK